MYTCRFIQDYASSDRIINMQSSEIRFVERVCRTSTPCADEFFIEKTAYNSNPVVDTPQGRYEGLEQIDLFCAAWLKSFRAKSAEVIPVVQTTAGERSATEMVVRLDLGERTQEIPMMVIGDVRVDGKMEGLRVYFWWNWVEGFSPYRPPVYKPTYTTPGELSLLTGYMRQYYESLHNPNSAEALEDIMGTMEDEIKFGGYAPVELERKKWGEFAESGLSNLEMHRNIYRDDILYNTPKWRSVRFETIIDDGKTCVIEWVLTVNPVGIENHTASQAGVAAYERGLSGKLKAIRICDNLQRESEKELDFANTKITNYITAYPHIGYNWLHK